MPRTRVRKTNRSSISTSTYEQAYDYILSTGNSSRAAATLFGLCHVSLIRYKKKRENSDNDEVITMGYNTYCKVFTKEQEIIIAKYLLKAVDLYCLTIRDIRKLAHNLAVKYNLTSPSSWDTNGLAGEFWYAAFMQRNPDLLKICAQLKKNATNKKNKGQINFNKINVEIFLEHYEKVIERHKIEPKNIYTIDEVGISTVCKSDRIITRTKMGQVSEEQDPLVTVTLGANAIGCSIPSMFVFPSLGYSSHFVRNGPLGSIGIGNLSGWMQEKDFLIFLEHFQNHTQSSKENNILLLLEYHESYVTVSTLDYCKEHGIVMLFFPPYCSHKLQPVNRLVYGVLKKAVNSTCDAWMRNHPNNTMSMYEIPSIVSKAYPWAFTSTHIQVAFRSTGIYPYNKDLFTKLYLDPSNDDAERLINYQNVQVTTTINSEATTSEHNSPSTEFHKIPKTADNNNVSLYVGDMRNLQLNETKEGNCFQNISNATPPALQHLCCRLLSRTNIWHNHIRMSSVETAQLISEFSFMKDLIFDYDLIKEWAFNTLSELKRQNKTVIRTPPSLSLLNKISRCMQPLPKNIFSPIINQSTMEIVGPSSITTFKNMLTPEDIRPFLKAIQPKTTNQDSNKRKSETVTDASSTIETKREKKDEKHPLLNRNETLHGGKKSTINPEELTTSESVDKRHTVECIDGKERDRVSYSQEASISDSDEEVIIKIEALDTPENTGVIFEKECIYGELEQISNPQESSDLHEEFIIKTEEMPSSQSVYIADNEGCIDDAVDSEQCSNPLEVNITDTAYKRYKRKSAAGKTSDVRSNRINEQATLEQPVVRDVYDAFGQYVAAMLRSQPARAPDMQRGIVALLTPYPVRCNKTTRTARGRGGTNVSNMYRKF